MHHGKTVHFREHDIEDYDIVVLLQGGVEAVLPVVRVVREIFFGVKQFEECRCEAALILHQ